MAHCKACHFLKGKSFSLLAVADNAVPRVSATIYDQVYKATIHTHPATIFYVTIASQVVVSGIFLLIHTTSTEESLIHEEIADEDASVITQSEENAPTA